MSTVALPRLAMTRSPIPRLLSDIDLWLIRVSSQTGKEDQLRVLKEVQKIDFSENDEPLNSYIEKLVNIFKTFTVGDLENLLDWIKEQENGYSVRVLFDGVKLSIKDKALSKEKGFIRRIRLIERRFQINVINY